MSNKLIKEKDLEAKRIRRKRIRKLLAVLLVMVSILFVFLWTRVAITSVKFKKQMEQMVLGKDYFIEDVVIRKKGTYTSPAESIVYLPIISSTMIQIRGCRSQGKYIRSMKWEILFQLIPQIMFTTIMKKTGFYQEKNFETTS